MSYVSGYRKSSKSLLCFLVGRPDNFFPVGLGITLLVNSFAFWYDSRGVRSVSNFWARLAGKRLSLNPSTLITFSKGPSLTEMICPRVISLEGLTGRLLILTWLHLHASVAKLRDLKIRITQSQRSIRILIRIDIYLTLQIYFFWGWILAR